MKNVYKPKDLIQQVCVLYYWKVAILLKKITHVSHLERGCSSPQGPSLDLRLAY